MSSITDAVYLDHAATSWPKPDSVRRCVLACFTELFVNAGRSGHAASLRAAERVFETREKLASLLGVGESGDLVFTSGATEGINLILKGFLKPGDLVFVSPMEHNAVMRPLLGLAETRGVRVEALPADRFGRVDCDAARRMGRDDPPRLVAVAHASNVNGAVQDLAALREALPDSALLVDAAQTAGVLPIDVGRDGIDFLALSAHKGLLGPTGLGATYLHPRHDVRPLLEGGTGSRSADTRHPEFRPDRYEAGTLNLHGIAGLSGALEHLARADLGGERKRRLTGILVAALVEMPGVRVHSPADGSALMAAFTVEHLPPDRVARRLEHGYGILCRPGLQCAPRAHRHLGTFPAGVVRLSPGFGNTEAQMRRAADAVGHIAGEAR